MGDAMSSHGSSSPLRRPATRKTVFWCVLLLASLASVPSLMERLQSESGPLGSIIPSEVLPTELLGASTGAEESPSGKPVLITPDGELSPDRAKALLEQANQGNPGSGARSAERADEDPATAKKRRLRLIGKALAEQDRGGQD